MIIKIFKLSPELHWYVFEVTEDLDYAQFYVDTWPGKFRYEIINEGR